MKLEVKVTHTPDTKSKKPWRKIHWLGSKCDILLQGHCRLKVLHLQDKNTKKKKISRLQSAVKKLLVCNVSQNGDTLVGIIDNGDIIIWNRVDDTATSISTPAVAVKRYFEERQSNQRETDDVLQKNKIFVSNDSRNVLLVFNLNQIFLWEADELEVPQISKDLTRKGKWYLIHQENAPLPPSHSKDASVDSIFFEDLVLGHSNMCSFVFYKGAYLQVSSVLIQWQEPWKKYSSSKYPFQASWYSLAIPVDVISPGCQPIHESGALIARHCSTGMILAVGINQDIPSNNKVAFLSVLSHSLIVSDLLNCGCKTINPNREIARTYWIADCSWSYNAVFLACIMKKGSLFLLSSLGEIFEVETDGCSVVFGPSPFLPLHPLITVVSSRGQVGGQESQPEAQNDVQQFSVTFHPSSPVLICSDGFLATVMELLTITTASGLIREYLHDGRKALSKLPKHILPKMKYFPTLEVEQKHTVPFNDNSDITMSQFLSTDTSQHEVLVSGQYASMSDGKLAFGSLENPAAFLNKLQDQSDQTFEYQAERYFLLAWLFGASQAGDWNQDLNQLQLCTSKYLAMICLASFRNNDKLMAILTLQRSLACMSLDIIHSNIICSTLCLMHQAFSGFTFPKSAITVSQLSHMMALLLHLEERLHETYSTRPVASESFQFHANEMFHRSDEVICQPTFQTLSDLPRVWNNTQSIAKSVGKCNPFSKCTLPTWKLLYQKTVMMYIACNEHVATLKSDDVIFVRMKSFLMNMIGLMQRKLCLIGCEASLHLHYFWNALQDENFLKGCERLLLGDLRKGSEFCVQAYKTSKQQMQRHMSDGFVLAILYSNLMSYNIQGALQLVNNVIESASVDARKLKMKRSFKELLEDKTKVMIPILREDCRKLVMSMGRFMALYFTNKQLFICQPFSAKPLPVLFAEKQGTVRHIILHQHLIASNIHEQGVSAFWTPDVTLNLLLLAGLFPEAIWFSNEVGDWRTAFTLSVIYNMKFDHLASADDDSHRVHEELRLPDSLSASSLLCERIDMMMQPPEEWPYSHQEDHLGIGSSGTLGAMESSEEAEANLRNALPTIFLAGTLSGLEIVPYLLGSILQQCLLSTYQLSLVVHEKYYLPAPPFYCPQPDYNPTDEDPAEVVEENALRRKITYLVKQFLIVLETSNCSRVSARWYVEQLDNVQTWAFAKKRAESQDLPTALHQHSNFPLDIMEGLEASSDIQPGTRFLLKCVRDLCTMLWMLHLRDKLSESLRQRKVAQDSLQTCKTEDITKIKEQLKCKHEHILLWSKLFLPFAAVFGQSEDIKDIILTTVMELELCKEHVASLAYSFYNEEALPLSLAEKFQLLKKRLSQKKVYQERKLKKESSESVKCMSLLMYFKLQCKMRRLALKSMWKAFGDIEETIFPPVQGLPAQYAFDQTSAQTPVVGSRELEYSPQFLNFLETFFLVTFGSLPSAKVQNLTLSLPLLNEFYHDVWNQELGLKLRKVPKRHEVDVEINTHDLVKWLESSKNISHLLKTKMYDVKVDEGLFQRNFQTFNCDDVIEMSSWERESANLIQNLRELDVSKGSFLDCSVSMGFTTNNIFWGSQYAKLQKLLNWFKLWSEEQHDKFVSGEAGGLSGIRLKLHPPRILVVVGLWLLRYNLQKTYKRKVSQWKQKGDILSPGKSETNLSGLKFDVADATSQRSEEISSAATMNDGIDNEMKRLGNTNDVTISKTTSVRRVLPSEPDFGKSSKHQAGRTQHRKSSNASRNRPARTDEIVSREKKPQPLKVKSEFISRSKQTSRGVMKSDVNVYIDDSSSSDTDASEEEYFEPEEDISLSLPELPAHLVRKSSFGSYDKTKIPSVAEDTMGIHTNSSSFSVGNSQGDIIDSKRNNSIDGRSTLLTSQHRDVATHYAPPPKDAHMEKAVEIASATHQESQITPIGKISLTGTQPKIDKIHQHSQTIPVDINTLEISSKPDTNFHQQQFVPEGRRNELSMELEVEGKQKRSHIKLPQEEKGVMRENQNHQPRLKSQLEKYLEGQQSATHKAHGVPFPILTLPTSDVCLIAKHVDGPTTQEQSADLITSYPLLTLDRDTSPVLQTHQSAPEKVCLPLIHQTSLHEVREAKILRTDINDHIPSTRKGKPLNMLSSLDMEPPQLLTFPKEHDLYPTHETSQCRRADEDGHAEQFEHQMKNLHGIVENREKTDQPEKDLEVLHVNEGLNVTTGQSSTKEEYVRDSHQEEVTFTEQSIEGVLYSGTTSTGVNQRIVSKLTTNRENHVTPSPSDVDILKEQSAEAVLSSGTTPASVNQVIVNTHTTDSGNHGAPPSDGDTLKAILSNNESSFLASGLRAVNRVVAPKVFMEYDKENAALDEIKQIAHTKKSSSEGAFLSVVDLGAGILRNLLNQTKEVETSSLSKEECVGIAELNSQHFHKGNVGGKSEETDASRNDYKRTIERRSSEETSKTNSMLGLDDKLQLLENESEDCLEDLEHDKVLLQSVATNWSPVQDHHEETCVSTKRSAGDKISTDIQNQGKNLPISVQETVEPAHHEMRFPERQMSISRNKKSGLRRDNFQDRVKEAKEMMTELLASVKLPKPSALQMPLNRQEWDISKKQRTAKHLATDRSLTDLESLQNPSHSDPRRKSKTYAEILLEMEHQTSGSLQNTKKLALKEQVKEMQPRKKTYRKSFQNEAGNRKSKLERRTSGSPSIPRPISVMRSRGLSHQPVPYVQRLQLASEKAPQTFHQDVYVYPTDMYSLKSRTRHSVPSRHQPYVIPPTSDRNDNDISDISSWSISEDIKQLLCEESEKSSEMSAQDNYLSSVDIKELENMASIGSASSFSIDWDGVEDMVGREQQNSSEQLK